MSKSFYTSFGPPGPIFLLCFIPWPGPGLCVAKACVLKREVGRKMALYKPAGRSDRQFISEPAPTICHNLTNSDLIRLGHFAAESICQFISRFKSLGSWLKHLETGPKSTGIGLCQFVGTAPGIFGLASSGVVADLGPESTIPGRILKRCRGAFSSAGESV